MVTINTMVSITEEGILSAKVPQKIHSGKYNVVVVLDEMNPINEKKKKLNISTYPGSINENTTFRREELYDDTGR